MPMIDESDNRPPVALEQRDVSADQRMFSPSAARNLAPILAVLKQVLPAHGVVLEIGCGTGEHAVHFAGAMPSLTGCQAIRIPTPRQHRQICAARQVLAAVLVRNVMDVCRVPRRPRIVDDLERWGS